MPDDFTVAYGAGQGELEVGGVFLRIFIAQPGWVLRKPREFLVSLLETMTELLEKNNPNVRNRNTAFVLFSIIFLCHTSDFHLFLTSPVSCRVRPWRRLPRQQFVCSAHRASWPTRCLLWVTCVASWQHSTTRTRQCPSAPSASSTCCQTMRWGVK